MCVYVYILYNIMYSVRIVEIKVGEICWVITKNTVQESTQIQYRETVLFFS